MLKYAEKLAADNDIVLNYSEASLAAVNQFLLKLHGDYTRDPDKEAHAQSITGIALALGAYIIEVIDRAHGQGVWLQDTSKSSERETYPYVNHDITIYPVDWCLDAIIVGKAENILDKYDLFKRALNPASLNI